MVSYIGRDPNYSKTNTWVDIAAASTTNLGSVETSCIRVTSTGTATITSFGTAIVGTRKIVRFAAALTITHSPTTLILPQGVTILTAANDICELVSLGGSSWLMINYLRATDGFVYQNADTLALRVNGSNRVTIDSSGNTSFANGINIDSILSPPTLTADQNNYSPTGWPNASIFRLSSDNTRALTGILAPNGARLLTIVNVGSFPIQFMDESSSSSIANRFAFNSSSVTILTDQSLTLLYDTTSTRWRVISSSFDEREISALANVTSGADLVPYFTDVGTATTTSLTSLGRSIIASTTRDGFLSTISLPIASSPEALAGVATDRIMTPALTKDAIQKFGAPAGTTQYFYQNPNTVGNPNAWVRQSGDYISRTTFAGIFAAIGTTYGQGDGVNFFSTPMKYSNLGVMTYINQYTNATLLTNSSPYINLWRHQTITLGDGRVLVIGGATSGALTPISNVRFFVVSNINGGYWKDTTPLPIPLYDHTATLLQDGRILVMGGITSGPTATLNTYFGVINGDDTITWSAGTALPAARYSHGSVKLQNSTIDSKEMIYIAGGIVAGSPSATSIIAKITVGSTTITYTNSITFPTTVYHPRFMYKFGVLTLINGYINNALNVAHPAYALYLNPSTDVMNAATPAPSIDSSIGAPGTSLGLPAVCQDFNDFPIILGGVSSGIYSRKIFQGYTSAYSGWNVSQQNMIRGVYGHTANFIPPTATRGGILLIMGGSDNTGTVTTDMYVCPVETAWMKNS